MPALCNTEFVVSGVSALWTDENTYLRPTNTRGVSLGRLTQAQVTAMTGIFGAAQGGVSWFNTGNSQFEGWDGTQIVILG